MPPNMHRTHTDYIFTDDCSKLDLDAVYGLLHNTYWANERPREQIIASFKSPASVCFGLLHNGTTVGCARLVTDRITFAWLADVVIHPDHRGKGLGKFMIQCITEDPEYGQLRTVLGTRDAHGLYEKFGFVRKELMIRKRGQSSPFSGSPR